MIGWLRGILLAKQPPSLLLDVGGVGYELDAPMSTFYQLPPVGEPVTLFTHLLVREDAQALFGFSSERERGLFRTLLRINGVGARLALTILSGLSVEEFQQCVELGDGDRLTRLPGVGKKTAERLLVELRDRLPPRSTGTEPSVAGASSALGDPTGDAIAALIALGFKPTEAAARVRRIPAEGKRSEDLIRLALQSVAR